MWAKMWALCGRRDPSPSLTNPLLSSWQGVDTPTEDDAVLVHVAKLLDELRAASPVRVRECVRKCAARIGALGAPYSTRCVETEFSTCLKVCKNGVRWLYTDVGETIFLDIAMPSAAHPDASVIAQYRSSSWELYYRQFLTRVF